MNIFNILKKLSESSPRKNSPDLSESNNFINDIDVEKTKPLTKDDKADFQLLLSIYKENKVAENIDFSIFVKKISPDATSHKCPYCSTIHEFVASRARKCPICEKKMVVRQGLFITEEQAEKMETLVQDYYNKQGLVTRIGYLLESAQNSRVRKDYAEYFTSLAEAFRYMAQIVDYRGSSGYSFWDKAWGYYNSARLEAMKGLVDKEMMPYSNLPSISWSMTQMLLDEATTKSTSETKRRSQVRALTQACMTLAEAAKLNADPYFITELYSLTKKQMDELAISSQEFNDLSAKVISQTRLKGSSLNKYENWIQSLLDYVVI